MVLARVYIYTYAISIVFPHFFFSSSPACIVAATQSLLPTMDWSNITKRYETIDPITGGEADFVPVWTSRLVDYYPHNQGYTVARFEYPRIQPRRQDGTLAVGHQPDKSRFHP